jgi:hypothetical protein
VDKILKNKDEYSPEDLEDLVNFRVTGKQGLASAHFGEDGAYGPHIDTGGILFASKQNFGGAVPQCDDLG